MFRIKQAVRVFDTDPAGLIFFGNIFRFTHVAFEEFLLQSGIPIADIIRKYQFLPVAIKTEAEYLKPIRLGDVLSIELKVEKITLSTFTLKYDFYREAEYVAVVKTTHASISGGISMRTPQELVCELKKHRVRQD